MPMNISPKNPNWMIYQPEYQTPYLANMLSGDWKITGDPNAKNDFLSRFDPTFSGFNWDGGGAGTGLYGSALLDQLAGRLSSNMANPETSLEMGLLKDQFAGQRATAQQQLNDRYAGYGRGAGPQAAQQLALEDTMNRNESGAKRQMLSDLLQQTIANSLGLEGLRSGNYNDQQHRIGGDAQWRGNLQGQMMGTLSDFLRGNSGQMAGNQQQSFQNKLGLDTANEGTNRANFEAKRMADNTYKNQMRNWGNNWRQNNLTNSSGNFNSPNKGKW